VVAYLIGHTVSNELKKQTDYLFSLLIFLVSPVDNSDFGEYNQNIFRDFQGITRYVLEDKKQNAQMDGNPKGHLKT